MWFKKNKSKILITAVIAAALVAAFFLGDSTLPEKKAAETAVDTNEAGSFSDDGNTMGEILSEKEKDGLVTVNLKSPEEKKDNGTGTQAGVAEKTQSGPESGQAESGGQSSAVPGDTEPEKDHSEQNERDAVGTIPQNEESGTESTVSEGSGSGVEETEQSPEDVEGNGNLEKTDPDAPEKQEERGHSCTVSISCGTILDNKDLIDAGKLELVPAGGVILEPVIVPFYDEESVFNVLQRVCRENSIHMEFMKTPVYGSAYIEGIGNIYEFDCGPLSGWMYSVDGWFPNYGSSRYKLTDGCTVKWQYSCDLGNDIGGGYAGGLQKDE